MVVVFLGSFVADVCTLSICVGVLVQLAAGNPNGDDDDSGVLGESLSVTESTDASNSDATAVTDAAAVTDVTSIVVQPEGLLDDDA